MEAYDLIRAKLVDFSKIEDDKIFIQYLIVEKCVALLEFSQSMIANDKGAFIAPLLREVFEYTIILAGLDEFVSLNEFINHEKNDRFVRRIRDKMEEYALKKKKTIKTSSRDLQK